MSDKIFSLGQLPIAAFALNQSGKVLAYNEAAEQLIAKPTNQVLGKKSWNLLGGSSKESPLKEAFLSGETSCSNISINGKSVTLRGKPHENEDGDISLVVYTATELSTNDEATGELQGTLDAIDKSQARIEFELDGTIITANDNFLQAVDYSLDEVSGKHHSMFVGKEFAASSEYRNFWAKLNRGEYDSGEYKRFGKGGKEIWIQAAYNPIFDAVGKPKKIVKFATDITEQKLKNADFQGQIDAVSKSQAVIEFNMDGTIITANDNFLQALGYPLDEVAGRHHRMFVDSEFSRSLEYESFWKKLNRGEFEQAEFRRIGKGGKEVWIQASYNPIFDLNGNPFKVVKYATVVTDVVRARAKAISIQGVVDNSPNPTMICDTDFKITYANAVSLRMLEKLEEHLPIKAQQLIGSSIDIFHKVPREQRKLLSDPNNLPHTAIISIGPEKFRMQVFALRDEDGNYTGPALAWEVVTAQLKAEDAALKSAQEARQIKAVVDNAPNPTMLIDADSFIVTYANPVAIKTLESLEQYLPIRAKEIVGTCIDVFHKRPEHQRKLLADPSNLPYETRIEVGPETLHLQVYGLFDENGKYVAPALAWNIITESAQMEKRDLAAKEAVAIVQDALTQVAAGNVDIEITENFDGDLNDMRDNVNGIAELLRRFKTVMGGLAENARVGNLSERADASQFQGAYGEIIGGVNNTLDAIMGPLSNIREKLTQVATGDLTAYAHEEYEGEHAALKNALNSTLDGLNDLLGQVTESADQIASSSGQVAAAAQDLSQGASEQAATIEEISAQMSQLTTQTTQNAENAAQANQLAVTARDGAKAGDERMNEMLGAMREIEEASTNISKIIKVIDEIAFQTNLLALNAAVEAARAGVHGKGFAVVAEEVRNLAARSARAAKETTDMIEGSIKKVSLGTNIAQETAAALGAIVSDVGKVTDLVAEIAAASNEQAEGINQVNGGLDQVNQVTQRNTATSEQSAASAEEMNGQTGEMQSMIGKFKLSEVRAKTSDGMTPEMMAMLQGYVEKMMGKQAAAKLVQTKTDTGARPKDTTPLNISLDSGEFGKY